MSAVGGAECRSAAVWRGGSDMPAPQMGASASPVGDPARALCVIPGCGSVGEAGKRAGREALALVESESLARPACGYRVWPVRRTRNGVFDLGERSLHIPGFAGFSGEIAAVAAGACTLGARLETRVSALFRARRRLVALELDVLGTESLFRLADRVVARIRSEARRAGLRTSAALNPGDPGLALGEQPGVLALAEGEPRGIALAPGGMLRPVKSLTFIVALGRALPESSVARCERCSARNRCRFRKS